MNKQEAVRYVELRLAQGMPREAVIEGLAAELRAPRELIEPFVAQAEANFHRKPAPPASLLTDDSAPSRQARPRPQAPETSTPIPTAEDLVAWVKELDPHAAVYASTAGDEAAILVEATQATEAGPPKPENPRIAPAKINRATEIDPPNMELDDPELARFVTKQFISNRSRDDVLLAVCERSGANWAAANRFVGQVAAQNHPEINAYKNILVLPVGTIIVLVGMGLLLFGCVSSVQIARALLGVYGEQERSHAGTNLLQIFLQTRGHTPLTLVFYGALMTFGGAVGLIEALNLRLPNLSALKAKRKKPLPPSDQGKIFDDQN